MASKATKMSAPCSAQLRPARPSSLRRADPTRPLCVRVLDSTGYKLAYSLFRRDVQESVPGHALSFSNVVEVVVLVAAGEEGETSLFAEEPIEDDRRVVRLK